MKDTFSTDFNQFLNRRLSHVESLLPVMHNTAAIALQRTLNKSQLQLLVKAFDYSINRSSILEEKAYRQGFLDGMQLMGSLKCL